jgi:copper chaperone CopZ
MRIKRIWKQILKANKIRKDYAMDTIECTVSIPNKESKTRLKNALTKIKGVQEVDINPAANTVMVTFNEPATTKLIKDSIRDSGLNVEM